MPYLEEDCRFNWYSREVLQVFWITFSYPLEDHQYRKVGEDEQGPHVDANATGELVWKEMEILF